MGQQGPAPPYSPTFEVKDDDYAGRARGPEVIPASGRADAYRSSRPTVVYPSNPHHTAVDVGGQYGYTKPGELAQYDLDHPQHTRHRRHESFDHYARPNIYYNPEHRGFNIETNRTHDGNGPATKAADVRGGPPPTTRGLDKLNRTSTAYDPVSTPPTAPVPPSPLDVIQSNPRERRGSNRHARPVSLYQEAPPRPVRDDGAYRPRDDERPSRKERDHDQGMFVDDRIRNRGFGIRTDPMPEADDRREKRERTRREHPDSARRVEDDYDREWERVERAEAHELDDGKERRRRKPRVTHDDEMSGAAGREGDVEVEGGKRLKDNFKAGLGIAASAVGLGRVGSKNRKPEREDREATRERADKQDKKEKERRRREPEDEGAAVVSSDDDDEVEIISARASDRYRPRDKVYVSRDRRGRERDRVESSERPSDVAASGSHDRRERAAEDADPDDGPTKPSRDAAQPEDGEIEKPRKKGRLPSFDPNDTEDLNDIKEQLANMKVYDREDNGERVMVVEPPSDPNLGETARPERSVSARRDQSTSGGREIVPSPEGGKSVRVVSPTPLDRERPDSRPPIRGILKAPRPRFPEDPNPIREGVAPHKDDEKIKAAPPGARWTRVSRKIVNPEALEKGQERYEVRDDFVIVLRVLSRDEIEDYAELTAKLRGESHFP
ncbi:hypothetical protein IMZ48_08620 [Candidatus Bathyarchaeota archaeon]|nr:hypothetical protein [Candidatus Bathyarchaeota archaeon]